jgi:hypothetical protein
MRHCGSGSNAKWPEEGEGRRYAARCFEWLSVTRSLRPSTLARESFSSVVASAARLSTQTPVTTDLRRRAGRRTFLGSQLVRSDVWRDRQETGTSPDSSATGLTMIAPQLRRQGNSRCSSNHASAMCPTYPQRAQLDLFQGTDWGYASLRLRRPRSQSSAGRIGAISKPSPQPRRMTTMTSSQAQNC